MSKKPIPKGLLQDVRTLIAEARRDVARSVNSALVALYWNVGRRIRQDVLKEKRAEYGEGIVAALGRQLEMEFGRGFSEKNLRRMVQFAEVFQDWKIVVSLLRQLSWTHFLRLIPLDDPLKREFYAEMCRIERWSVRTLEHKIGHFLYERTAVAKKPADLIEQDIKALREEDRLTPDMVFKDPYFLDFLGLKDRHIEKDLEAARFDGPKAAFDATPRAVPKPWNKPYAPLEHLPDTPYTCLRLPTSSGNWQTRYEVVYDDD
jgi:hypothetical protein